MDVCSWDWGAIASFTSAGATILSPIIVALYAYNKWHNQQGKGVMANEAKITISFLNEINNLNDDIYKLFSNPQNTPIQKIQDSIQELELKGKSLQEYIDFLEDCFKYLEVKKYTSMKDVSISIRREINSYKLINDRIKNSFIIQTDGSYKFINNESLDNELKNTYIGINDRVQFIKKKLIPYALYQEK